MQYTVHTQLSQFVSIIALVALPFFFFGIQFKITLAFLVSLASLLWTVSRLFFVFRGIDVFRKIGQLLCRVSLHLMTRLFPQEQIGGCVSVGTLSKR